MKQLKRAAAVLLAVCLIFSLAACGGVNIDKTAKNLHIEQAENIRVWYCETVTWQMYILCLQMSLKKQA